MIPAGIQTGEVEFYNDGELRTMYSGHIIEYRKLPSYLHKIVERSIDSDSAAALDELGFIKPLDRHIQWLSCNCGTYDFTPDIAPGDTTVQREFVQCLKRGACTYEGRLCKWINVDGQRVTLTELKIISAIRAGHSDKVICSDRGIAIDTLRSHKKSIQRKLKALGKVQIATQSIKYGIS